MPRKSKKQSKSSVDLSLSLTSRYWLMAGYHFHVFHYRMPETVAIASVTPFVPSPLTIKMALVAALLQSGYDQTAQKLAQYLPQIDVRIIPPSSALSFKAFLRYRSVPAIESGGGLDEAGSYYPSRPHTREYALFSDELRIFLGLPKGLLNEEAFDEELLKPVKKALRLLRYLGSKDSLVTCLYLQNLEEKEIEVAKTAKKFQEVNQGTSGAVVLAVDFNPDIRPNLMDLIPGVRRKEHYECFPLVLPGRIISKGRSKIFCREQ
ncbi:hypothetical protein O163_06695 [Caldanaerobacter subterraneus subsp. yonseiensis KB-1]|uniref:CRISPR-associated protein Cas5 n=1 Tax=Caldanaerobacter subterraneus subsp. yonseiensis KB-1 TaxID=1388761 RepID=U5CQT1_CALSX|nr:hypothetical protein [Caldanaerobacter subterraneus]ERM92159.1 hypothetical protein O163_06695 [Caldanaerobacter subterraneus subsp. yonseiensis KB-1]